ncbi:MAG: hypothetical protein JNN07_26245 [Verrucomicrobiales bacterium]|nr:hypothetical protein [Verrucomicrobiales bacterium]
MGLPSEPVTLSPQEIADLLKQLSNARHDINNALSLISAATELMRMKPELVNKMVTTLNDQPAKITSSLQQFSQRMEQVLRTRPVG